MAYRPLGGGPYRAASCLMQRTSSLVDVNAESIAFILTQRYKNETASSLCLLAIVRGALELDWDSVHLDFVDKRLLPFGRKGPSLPLC